MLELPLAGYWLKVLQPELSRLSEPWRGWFYTLLPAGDLQVSLAALMLLGLVVGLLTGFFGIGGSFLMTPWLNLGFLVPYNVAIGTDLTQMIGTATLAGLRQGGQGFIDYRLGLLLFAGSVVGLESGAQLLEVLKKAGSWQADRWQLPMIQVVMTVIYGILLAWIGTLVLREAWAAWRATAPTAAPAAPGTVSSRLRTLHLKPLISLPVSGVESISLWVILLVGFCSGLLTGLLGVSGSFIRMPAMIYVLGVPTVVSLGTNLFELFLSSCYGAWTHSLKGNVELPLVAILLVASVIGSHLGSILQRRLYRPELQLGFAGLIWLTVVAMLAALGRGVRI